MYPIALFAYKRPAVTRRTIDGLRANPEFDTSPIFIYCDGPKHSADIPLVSATRKLVRSYNLANAVIVERDHNVGLANSIIAGVTELCKKFGAVIVIEDDILVSHSFLAYMNNALAQYANIPKVMAIAGHTFVDCSALNERRCQSDAVFLPFANSWGWATWQRAWSWFDANIPGLSKLESDALLRRKFDLEDSYPFFRMLKLAASGRIDSWAIRWYLSIFVQDGLVLYPARTLAQHVGHDGAGTHVSRYSRTRTLQIPNDFDVKRLPIDISVDPAVLVAARASLRKARPSRIGSFLRMMLPR